MDNRFETSFIPQQPLLRVEGLGKRREYINFAVTIALVLFFVTVTVAVGVYFYERQIHQEILASSQELESLEGEIGASSIESFKTLDGRLAAAKMLIADHKAFSAVLDFLEGTVATDIAITNLTYSVHEENKTVAVSVSGQGLGYAPVYRQEEYWRTLGAPILALKHNTLTLNEKTGLIEFTDEVTLDGARVLYKDHMDPRPGEQERDAFAGITASAPESTAPPQSQAEPRPSAATTTLPKNK